MKTIDHKFPNGVIVKMDFHDEKEYQSATKKSNPYGMMFIDKYDVKDGEWKLVKRINIKKL